MNKTISISISGIIFHVEEDAYGKLQNYLASIRNKFSAEEGRDEIMADIEARIAEILSGRTGHSKEVIVMEDIDYVISLMGEPEVISDSAEEQNKSSQNKSDENKNNDGRKYRRRLFRDTDDKVVGGVCSGLGYYFDVDPIWIRIGFVVFTMAFGGGAAFYFLLMIIMPKADSTAEKLEMRGEPVDINNISKTIKEEMTELGERMKKFGKEARDEGNRWKEKGSQWRNESNEWYRRNRSGSDTFFDSIFRLIGKLFAFLLIAVGIGLLIGIFTSTIAINGFRPGIFSDTYRSLFSSSMMYTLSLVAFFLVFGIPVLMMIYKGIRIMFEIKNKDRYVGLIALSFWVMGIVMGCIAIANGVNAFSDEAVIYEELPQNFGSSDTINVRVNIDKTMMNDDDFDDWRSKHRFHKKWNTVYIDNEQIKLGDLRLNIVPSMNDSVQFVISKSAWGRDKNEAITNAQSIDYKAQVSGNSIILDNHYQLKPNSFWREQEVETELRIPIGTVVFLHLSTRDILHNVDNTSNTYDYDMAGRRWKMTEKGLTCIDCDGLELPINNTEVKRDTAKTDSLPKK
jgi:phage shock protein PspC (stress-responsive transcriptional regulator)